MERIVLIPEWIVFASRGLVSREIDRVRATSRDEAMAKALAFGNRMKLRKGERLTVRPFAGSQAT